MLLFTTPAAIDDSTMIMGICLVSFGWLTRNTPTPAIDDPLRKLPIGAGPAFIAGRPGRFFVFLFRSRARISELRQWKIERKFEQVRFERWRKPVTRLIARRRLQLRRRSCEKWEISDPG